MHPLLANPGPRRLTNVLLGKIAWNDVSTRQPSVAPATVMSSYFADRYGAHASAWQAVTELMSQLCRECRTRSSGSTHCSWSCSRSRSGASPVPAEQKRTRSSRSIELADASSFPGGYSGRGAIAESFRGLDESLAIQDLARARWESVLAEPMSAQVRARMQADVAWFLSTSSRYRLMAATCDYILAAPHSTQQERARSQMEAELTFLSASPVLEDTISPVNQRAFLSYHRALLAGTQR